MSYFAEMVRQFKRTEPWTTDACAAAAWCQHERRSGKQRQEKPRVRPVHLCALRPAETLRFLGNCWLLRWAEKQSARLRWPLAALYLRHAVCPPFFFLWSTLADCIQHDMPPPPLLRPAALPQHTRLEHSSAYMMYVGHPRNTQGQVHVDVDEIG